MINCFLVYVCKDERGNMNIFYIKDKREWKREIFKKGRNIREIDESLLRFKSGRERKENLLFIFNRKWFI